MKVKITKCLSRYLDSVWYKDKIGEVFKVRYYNYYWYEVLDLVEGKQRYIRKEDCEIVKDEKKLRHCTQCIHFSVCSIFWGVSKTINEKDIINTEVFNNIINILSTNCKEFKHE